MQDIDMENQKLNQNKMKLIKTEDEQGVMYSLSGDNLPENYVLSKKNCDSIFGVVDVDSMIKDIETNCEKTKEGYILGFQMAMALNKDKLFTEEDMINFAEYCKGDLMKTKDLFNEYQSIQQLTEINVVIVMRPASLVYKSNLVIEELDSEGCLILKKI
jgi:hypothetical protein